MSLRTWFFQFETGGCQITRAPYQKEAQIYNFISFSCNFFRRYYAAFGS